MRALSACLSVILGMSVCYLAACSSDSDASGGAAGDTSSAGSSGKAGSNSSGAAGEATGGGAGEAMGGGAGAPGECAFDSDACGKCLVDKCGAQVTACSKATDCNGALSNLEPCACDPDKTPVMCETAFTADGGDQAPPLVDCFNQNCASVCAM